MMNDLNFTLNPRQVRLMAVTALRRRGKTQADSFTSQQSQAFLMVHGKELEEIIHRRVARFIADKLGVGGPCPAAE
jgi:hypothetical protein